MDNLDVDNIPPPSLDGKNSTWAVQAWKYIEITFAYNFDIKDNTNQNEINVTVEAEMWLIFDKKVTFFWYSPWVSQLQCFLNGCATS